MEMDLVLNNIVSDFDYFMKQNDSGLNVFHIELFFSWQDGKPSVIWAAVVSAVPLRPKNMQVFVFYQLL